MGYPIIHLQSEAPAKPATGAPCNGCGLCCAWQPCPLGMLASGRRHGACSALQWDQGLRLYRCGLVERPQAVWPRLPAPLQPAVQRLARRWIASGVGCDCDLEPGPAERPDQG